MSWGRVRFSLLACVIYILCGIRFLLGLAYCWLAGWRGLAPPPHVFSRPPYYYCNSARNRNKGSVALSLLLEHKPHADGMLQILTSGEEEESGTCVAWDALSTRLLISHLNVYSDANNRSPKDRQSSAAPPLSPQHNEVETVHTYVAKRERQNNPPKKSLRSIGRNTGSREGSWGSFPDCARILKINHDDDDDDAWIKTKQNYFLKRLPQRESAASRPSSE